MCVCLAYLVVFIFFFFPRIVKYGGNSIDVPVKPYHVLFFKEVLHPFYIFQVYAVGVWCSSEYYYYAGELWQELTLSVPLRGTHHDVAIVST